MGRSEEYTADLPARLHDPYTDDASSLASEELLPAKLYPGQLAQGYIESTSGPQTQVSVFALIHCLWPIDTAFKPPSTHLLAPTCACRRGKQRGRRRRR